MSKEKFAEKMGAEVGDPADLPEEVQAELKKRAEFNKHVQREVDPFGLTERTYYWTWYPTPDEPDTDGYEINLTIPQARIYERFVSYMFLTSPDADIESIFNRKLEDAELGALIKVQVWRALWLLCYQDDSEKQEDIDKLLEPNYKYEISIDRLYPELLKKMKYPDYLSYAEKAVVDMYDYLRKGVDAENPPLVKGSH
jgi:hypothetical protein